MSSSKFMVFNLRDLKIPLIITGIAVAAFMFFILSKDNKVTTFSSSVYQDGLHIANITLQDADFDLVVDVTDGLINSISLQNFTADERTAYQDINDSIAFVNNYVTSTQNTALPHNDNFSVGTNLLMDAVQVALSTDANATLVSTYQIPLLQPISPEESITDSEAMVNNEDIITEDISNGEDIFYTDELFDPGDKD